MSFETSDRLPRYSQSDSKMRAAGSVSRAAFLGNRAMCNNLACNLGRRAPRPPCSQVLVLAVQQGTALRRRIRRRPDPVRWANDVVEVDTEEDAAYQLLLQQADEHTFKVPAGETDDSVGRRAALAEGKRLLEIAVQMRPQDMLPRVMLLRNLMIQDKGRELEVPPLTLQALRELANIYRDDIMFTPAFVPAMQAVLLALKALWKLECQQEIPSFLEAASHQVPSMASDFAHLAARVEGQLHSCGQQFKEELLNSHRYLSCVDLQNVNGGHHLGSPGLESVDVLDNGGACGILLA